MTTTKTHRTLVALRVVVGVSSWLAPRRTWSLAGLGRPSDRGSSDAVTRLFGVRDLTLAWAAAQSDPAAVRTALRTGVVIDSVDTVSGLLAVRAGAPRAALLGVSAGAATLAILGALVLRDLDT